MEKISVIVCSKNEELRIEDCLRSIMKNNPDEIILVDGGSTDNTINIAKKYVSKIISNRKSNLTEDRQIGLNNCRNNIAAMIDCDHVLEKNQIMSLFNEMILHKYAIIQAQINIIEKDFWTKAENFALQLTEVPGLQNEMLGTAPALYNKKILNKFHFDSSITKTIDDTDYFYRLSKLKNIRFGTAKTKIKCFHEPGFFTYCKKFFWYGKGDAEFAYKHKNRLKNILFHLFIRYPLIHSSKALINLRIDSFVFFIAQGYIRLLSFFINYTKLNFQKLP
jgi:glycosyltransferase involved in cell wall biosynthesis